MFMMRISYVNVKSSAIRARKMCKLMILGHSFINLKRRLHLGSGSALNFSSTVDHKNFVANVFKEDIHMAF